MRIGLCLAATFSALTVDLPAQLQVFPKSKTDIAIFADDGSKPDLKFFAKGQGVKQDALLDAQSTSVRAGMFLRPFLLSRGFRFREYGYVPTGAPAAARVGTSTSTSASSITQSVHVFELSVRGQAQANLVLGIAGTVRGNGKASVQVDVDSDNKIEASFQVNGGFSRTVIPSFKGGTPRLVSILVDASASGPGSSFDFTMLAAVERTLLNRCHYSRIQVPCGTMTLDGIDAPQTNLHDLTFNAVAGVPNSPAVLLLGVTPVQVSLPGSPCDLFTLPLGFSAAVLADAAGDAQWLIRIPAPLKIGNVLWQSIMFTSGGQILLSGGARLDCR